MRTYATKAQLENFFYEIREYVYRRHKKHQDRDDIVHQMYLLIHNPSRKSYKYVSLKGHSQLAKVTYKEALNKLGISHRKYIPDIPGKRTDEIIKTLGTLYPDTSLEVLKHLGDRRVDRPKLFSLTCLDKFGFEVVSPVNVSLQEESKRLEDRSRILQAFESSNPQTKRDLLEVLDNGTPMTLALRQICYQKKIRYKGKKK